MEYAQLNEAGTEAIQITTHGNVEWDANNYCTAEALVKDGKADQFRVVPLPEVDQPEFDPMTQSCVRDGCEKVKGKWQYKWRVENLSDEQVAAKKSIGRAEELSKLSSTYKADISSLQMGWLSATVSGGSMEASKKSAIESDIIDAKAQYLLDVAEIKSKYA